MSVVHTVHEVPGGKASRSYQSGPMGVDVEFNEVDAAFIDQAHKALGYPTYADSVRMMAMLGMTSVMGWADPRSTGLAMTFVRRVLFGATCMALGAGLESIVNE